MPRFCANLTMMFNEHAFLDRFAAAAQAGFKAVEFLFPYDHPAADIRARLDDNGLEQILFNMPPGDWAMGERGLACLPGRQAEFRDGVKRALDYAAVLGTRRLHCMAGLPPAGLAAGTAAALYATNLAWACEQAHAAGVLVVIEPINHRDMPGFFLNTSGQGAALVEAVGRDRLALLFDVYHSPGHGGGRDQPDGRAAPAHRPRADCRRAGPQRARDGGAELAVHVPPHGRDGLRRLGGMRVPAGGRHGGRPAMAGRGVCGHHRALNDTLPCNPKLTRTTFD